MVHICEHKSNKIVKVDILKAQYLWHQQYSPFVVLLFFLFQNHRYVTMFSNSSSLKADVFLGTKLLTCSEHGKN